MTHFKIDIQLPLRFNPKTGQKQGEEVPSSHFHLTYKELLNLFGGVHTTNSPIMGSWMCPKTNKPFHDKSVVFSILVPSADKNDILKIPKIKQLKEYKRKLKKRFNQKEIYMVATRCYWL